MTLDEIPLAELQDLLNFGENVMGETRNLVLDLWGSAKVATSLKADLTPVTEVDLRAEELIRKRISERFPTHGVIGEEHGCENPASDFQWTVDPIDGTQNLANRIPTFGTLLGLRYRNQAVLGFIDHPALGVYSAGGHRMGVTVNGRSVSLPDLASDTLSPTDVIATSTQSAFNRSGDGACLHALMTWHPHTRIYHDCYAHSLTISGSLAATVEFGMKTWDVTPTEALVREAGGRFHYLREPEVLGATGISHSVFGKRRAVQLIVDLLNGAV